MILFRRCVVHYSRFLFPILLIDRDTLPFTVWTILSTAHFDTPTYSAIFLQSMLLWEPDY